MRATATMSDKKVLKELMEEMHLRDQTYGKPVEDRSNVLRCHASETETPMLHKQDCVRMNGKPLPDAEQQNTKVPNIFGPSQALMAMEERARALQYCVFDSTVELMMLECLTSKTEIAKNLCVCPMILMEERVKEWQFGGAKEIPMFHVYVEGQTVHVRYINDHLQYINDHLQDKCN